MSPLPVQKLAELIETHGPAFPEEQERCRGWLVYSCPDQKKEVNVLLSALAQTGPVSRKNPRRRYPSGRLPPG
jgi:hypothetical protein